MTDYADITVANSLTKFDWLTPQNVAECQAGQNKEGWDTAVDHLLKEWSTALSGPDLGGGKVLEAWWQQIEVAQGVWSNFVIENGSLTNHFGHVLKLDRLYEAFAYVVEAGATGVATKSPNGMVRGWLGFQENIGCLVPEGTLLHVNYGPNGVAVQPVPSHYSTQSFQGTTQAATILMGVLGYEQT